MFFVMSGFLMMVGYASKSFDGCCVTCSSCKRGPAKSHGVVATEFWMKRVARIGPTYWFSMLICIPLTVMKAQTGFPWLAYVTEALFLQTWFFQSVNPPLWSVCSQFFCYFWFPIVGSTWHTVRNTCRLFGEVVLYWQLYAILWIITFVALFLISEDFFTGYIIAHIHPTNKLPLFLIGAIFGSAAITRHPVPKSSRYTQFWRITCDATSSLVIGYWVGQLFGSFWDTGDSIPGLSDITGISRIFGELVLPPVYGLWLFSLTQAPSSFSARIFSIRLFRWLGDISFALYCLHWPLMEYYMWARCGNNWFSAPENCHKAQSNTIETIYMYIILVPVSWVILKVVEQPGRVQVYSLLHSWFIQKPSAAGAPIKAVSTPFEAQTADRPDNKCPSSPQKPDVSNMCYNSDCTLDSFKK